MDLMPGCFLHRDASQQRMRAWPPSQLRSQLLWKATPQMLAVLQKAGLKVVKAAPRALRALSKRVDQKHPSHDIRMIIKIPLTCFRHFCHPSFFFFFLVIPRLLWLLAASSLSPLLSCICPLTSVFESRKGHLCSN